MSEPMNLYITANNFSDCANNLDDIRLRKQRHYLLQCLSNAIHSNEDYRLTLQDADYYANSMIEKGFVSPLETAMLPVRFENHPLDKWFKQSYSHFMFGASYLRDINSVLSSRNITGSLYISALNKASSAITYVSDFLHNIFPTQLLNNLYSLDDSLYKSLPREFEELPTQEGYKKYLIKLWKADILKEKQYLDTSKINKEKNLPKPRIVQAVRFGRNGGGLWRFPEWANVEMVAFRKEIFGPIPAPVQDRTPLGFISPVEYTPAAFPPQYEAILF